MLWKVALPVLTRSERCPDMSSDHASEYEDGPSESEGFESSVSDDDDGLESGSSAKDGSSGPAKPGGMHAGEDEHARAATTGIVCRLPASVLSEICVCSAPKIQAQHARKPRQGRSLTAQRSHPAAQCARTQRFERSAHSCRRLQCSAGASGKQGAGDTPAPSSRSSWRGPVAFDRRRPRLQFGSRTRGSGL